MLADDVLAAAVKGAGFLHSQQTVERELLLLVFVTAKVTDNSECG